MGSLISAAKDAMYKTYRKDREKLSIEPVGWYTFRLDTDYYYDDRKITKLLRGECRSNIQLRQNQKFAAIIDS